METTVMGGEEKGESSPRSATEWNRCTFASNKDISDGITFVKPILCSAAFRVFAP